MSAAAGATAATAAVAVGAAAAAGVGGDQRLALCDDDFIVRPLNAAMRIVVGRGAPTAASAASAAAADTLLEVLVGAGVLILIGERGKRWRKNESGSEGEFCIHLRGAWV